MKDELKRIVLSYGEDANEAPGNLCEIASGLIGQFALYIASAASDGQSETFVLLDVWFLDDPIFNVSHASEITAVMRGTAQYTQRMSMTDFRKMMNEALDYVIAHT